MYEGPGNYCRKNSLGEDRQRVVGLARHIQDHHEAAVVMVLMEPAGGWPDNVLKADFWTMPLRQFNEQYEKVA